MPHMILADLFGKGVKKLKRKRAAKKTRKARPSKTLKEDRANAQVQRMERGVKKGNNELDRQRLKDRIRASVKPIKTRGA